MKGFDWEKSSRGRNNGYCPSLFQEMMSQASYLAYFLLRFSRTLGKWWPVRLMLDIIEFLPPWRLEQQTCRNNFPLLKHTLACHQRQPAKHSDIYGSHIMYVSTCSKTNSFCLLGVIAIAADTCMCNLLIDVGVFLSWTVHSPKFLSPKSF